MTYNCRFSSRQLKALVRTEGVVPVVLNLGRAPALNRNEDLGVAAVAELEGQDLLPQAGGELGEEPLHEHLGVVAVDAVVPGVRHVA